MQTLKQTARTTARNLKRLYSIRHIIIIATLVTVILWQEIQPQVPAIFAAQTITAENPKPNEANQLELDIYINTRAEQIYQSNNGTYREMARQEALQETAAKLMQINQHSPHVDYQYMQEVVDRSLTNPN